MVGHWNYGQTLNTSEGFHPRFADGSQTHSSDITSEHTLHMHQNCMMGVGMCDKPDVMNGDSFGFAFHQGYVPLLNSQFLQTVSGHGGYNDPYHLQQVQTNSFISTSVGLAEFCSSPPSLSSGSASSSRQSSFDDYPPPSPDSEEAWAPPPFANASDFSAAFPKFGSGLNADLGYWPEVNAHAGYSSAWGASSAFDSTRLTDSAQRQLENHYTLPAMPSRKADKTGNFVAKSVSGKQYNSTKTYNQASSNARRFERERNNPEKRTCIICIPHRVLGRSDALKHHIKTQHTCPICKRKFSTPDDLNTHMEMQHPHNTT